MRGGIHIVSVPYRTNLLLLVRQTALEFVRLFGTTNDVDMSRQPTITIFGRINYVFRGSSNDGSSIDGSSNDSSDNDGSFRVFRSAKRGEQDLEIDAIWAPLGRFGVPF